MTINVVSVNLFNDKIEEVLDKYNPGTIIIDCPYVPAIDGAWAVFACVKRSVEYKVIFGNNDITEEINNLVEAIKGYCTEIYN